MFTITKRKLYFNINNEYIESLCDKYAVNIPEEWKQNRLERDGPHYHITICDLDSMNVQLPLKKGLEIHGFYKSSEHAFLKVKWPKAEQFRKKYNNDIVLHKYNNDIVLHITLGFSKINYIQPTKTLIYNPDRLVYAVDYKNFYTTKEFIHQVDCDTCRIYDIPKFMKQTNSRVFIKQYLGNLGLNAKNEVCRVNNLLEQPRHINIVNSNNQGLLSEYKMVYASIPPNFSQVHDNLFISGSIHTKQHRDYLKHMGITTVITLLDWKLTSLDKYFEYYHFPTIDLTPPSLHDIHEIHRLIDRPGHKTLVHCRGGKGRSAVVMFTYMISQRFDKCPDLYLKHIKSVAKNRITILSPSQQSFVDKFNLHHVHLFHLMKIMNGKTFEEIKDLLKKEFCARVKQKDNLFIVSYNLIKTKFYELGTLALRGTIFKTNTNGVFENKLENVVCLPYYKFFNIGESLSYKADFDRIEEIEQKIDGSLIKLFYHNGWNVGTNNTLDAYECPVGRTSNTFGSLFDKISAQYPKFNLDSLNKKYIYCLEIVSPLNRVVLTYNDEYQLYHLLTRDMTTLEEIRDDEIGLLKPERYLFTDDVELLRYNKMETEGFVIRYENNQRVKVKTAWYINQHRKSSDLFDRTSPKYLLECLLNHTIDDLIGRYPDVKEPVDKVKTLLHRYESEFIEFITKHNLTSPVEDEKRIELFKSKVIQSIENTFLRKMISKYITNKISNPMEITNGYDQFLECYT